MAHEHPDVTPARSRRFVAAVALVLGLATVLGMVMLWPPSEPDIDTRRLGLVSDVYQATVVSARLVPCEGTEAENEIPCDRVRFRLDAGPDEGEVRQEEFPVSKTSPKLETGDKVVLGHIPNSSPGFDYQFLDRQRRGTLLWLTVAFAVAVVLLGRWRGLTALAGLAASIAVLLVFVLPALVDGTSPVLVAIVGASAVAYLALYLAHGVQTMTTVALLGTLAALGLTVGLAALFTELAHLTGFASEDALLVQIGSGELDLAAMVLAGMVFGALGALDDVTVTQASAVWELHAVNPGMSRLELYRSGLRIGRDHVASTVNTLALAYAGASLPLLILFVMSKQSLGSVANSEVVATEIIRTLVGSIGLVAAVPVTTWLAAALAPAGGEAPDGDGDGNGDPEAGAPPSRRRRPRRRGRSDDFSPEKAPEIPFDETAAPPGGLEDQFWKRRRD